MFAGILFEHLDSCGHWDIRRYLNLDVDVVFVSVHSEQMECWISLNGFCEAVLELRHNIWFEVLESALSAPNNMVTVLVAGMVQTLGSHEDSVAQTPLFRAPSGYHSSPDGARPPAQAECLSGVSW